MDRQQDISLYIKTTFALKYEISLLHFKNRININQSVVIDRLKCIQNISKNEHFGFCDCSQQDYVANVKKTLGLYRHFNYTTVPSYL